MRLYEFEGKELWKKFGIAIPQNLLISKAELGALVLPDQWSGYVVKAQTLHGKRADRGQIILTPDSERAQIAARKLFGQSANSSEFEHVLIEEKIPYAQSVYLAFSFSTAERQPVMILSAGGGSKIEDRATSSNVRVLDPLIGFHPSVVRELAFGTALPKESIGELTKIAAKLWSCFLREDCLLAEINPLVLTPDGTWVALDAKVEIDDDAMFRHAENTFHPRSNLGRLPTDNELEAWQIDRNDHRGVAGSSYIDLDGDIAILASGGGASLACMDALIAYGGRPANYTEYSGNPPREKVQRLTEIVLSKPGLRGCWVVGATANFTDILETLSGFLDGLRSITPKPTYPFLIRRAGPSDQAAFDLLRQAARDEGYDFRLYGSDTPMLSTAKMMVDLLVKK